MTHHSEEQPVQIDERTRLPLSVVIPIIGAALTLCFYGWSINSRLGNIERQLSVGDQTRWSYQDQETWALKLAKENPEIVVPSPADYHHKGN